MVYNNLVLIAAMVNNSYPDPSPEYLLKIPETGDVQYIAAY